MDVQRTENWLKEASRQSLLSQEVATEIFAEAKSSGTDAAEVAVRKGAIDALEADMVQVMLTPDQVVPGYELQAVVGRGGMGVVYKARQKNLDRIVAIKMIPIQDSSAMHHVQRFEKEATMVARLRHPNIVTAYDFGSHNGRWYFVMEYLEGEDLDRHLTLSGPVDESSAWWLARQTVSGLAHASGQGLVHRDIKPANLFLVAQPEGYALPPDMPLVKITDFGLVFHDSEALQSPRITKSGSALGTPVYMAPEQLSDSAVDRRADIYSLGASVVHMLTGEAPFPSAKIWDVLTAKMSLPTLPSYLSRASVKLISDMMAFERDKRIGDYNELLARIDQVLGSGELAAVTTSVHQPGTSTRRHGWTILASYIGVAVLMLATSSATIWWISQPGPPPTADLIPAATTRPLFNGVNLEGWQPLEGQWRVTTDAEGARVLQGSGLARRRLPMTEHYQLILNLQMFEADKIEIEFGFHSVEAGSPRLVLVMTGGQARLARSGRRGVDFIGSLDPVEFDDERGYHEVRLERHTTHWWVWFDGKLVGQSPLEKTSKLERMRLKVEGGPANFEGFLYTELIRPESSSTK